MSTKQIDSPAIRLNGQQFSKVLDLIKQSDSVELKVTVPETDQRSTVAVLDMDVLDAELRQVIFFDTADLVLNRAGLVVRARRIRKGGDSVVKLRPLEPSELSIEVRRSGSLKVEVDAMPGSFVCSGSMKSKSDNDEVKQVLGGKRSIRRLFSREQRAFYKQHAPKGLDLDSLTPLGPINVARLKCSPQGFRGMLVAEIWFYPDGSRILELSRKCAPIDTVDVAVKTRRFLEQHGINLTGEQQTKTRQALEYFSRLASKK